MTNRHSISFTVALHEAGPGGTIKVPSVFNYLQTAAGSHSNAIGFGGADILKKGYSWVISRYRLSIIKLPSLFDNITVTTWRFGEVNHYAIREFLVTDNEGGIMIKGTSSWILLNIFERKPVVPSKLFPGYPLDHERALDDDFPSIKQVSSPEKVKEFPVRLNDLDMNKHVNNSVYSSFIMETGEDMSEGKRLKDITLNFRAEAYYGQTVTSLAEKNGSDNIIHKLICKETGKELTRGITIWE